MLISPHEKPESLPPDHRPLVFGMAGTALIHLAVLAVLMFGSREPQPFDLHLPIPQQAFLITEAVVNDAANVSANEPTVQREPPEPIRQAIRPKLPAPSAKPQPKASRAQVVPTPPAEIDRTPPQKAALAQKPPTQTSDPVQPVLPASQVQESPSAAQSRNPESTPTGQEDQTVTPPASKSKLSVSPSGVEPSSPARVDARYASSNRKPEYPSLARRMRWEGTVTLEVTVSRDGRAKAVKLIESSGYDILDSSAIQAISTWRFVPGQVGGQAVEQTLQTRWQYRLEN